MVAMAIVAILASIAIPSYRQYVIRSHRRAAQTSMVTSQTGSSSTAANRAYVNKATLGYVLPTEVSDNYTWDFSTLNNAATPPTFTITFTAPGGPAVDGNLTLTAEGAKGPAGKW
jgi:type IV pilus assembly protein PilE